MSAPSASRRAPINWPSCPGGFPEAQKRQALRLLNQIGNNSNIQCPQPLSPVKRKRVSLFAYGSSDTEEEYSASELGQTAYACRHSKRSRSAAVETEKSTALCVDDKDILSFKVWDEGDLDDAPGSGRADEPFFDLDYDNELTVEYARSAESLQEVDLSDIYGFYGTSPEDDLSSDDNASVETFTSSEDLLERLDVKAYLSALPDLLSRRARSALLSRRTHVVDDEPLRVKMFGRRFKARLRAGDLTGAELMEIMNQRPMHSTYGDLNLPTPGQVAESYEEFDSCDVTELDAEDLSLMERPSTPSPHDDSDSDSESDSDDDCTPVYSSSQISNHLSRRELEAMGVYPDDNEQDLAHEFDDDALEGIFLSGYEDTSEHDYSSDLEDILEEDENSD
ncbi:hypothetical protein BDV93DRAFT_508920 [Ceratobasidium sp. AG-I]|nr:hypothetical protein BDV93DRAFT_508920 [Ceratobasidium sp. AG-I]